MNIGNDLKSWGHYLTTQYIAPICSLLPRWGLLGGSLLLWTVSFSLALDRVAVPILRQCEGHLFSQTGLSLSAAKWRKLIFGGSEISQCKAPATQLCQSFLQAGNLW